MRNVNSLKFHHTTCQKKGAASPSAAPPTLQSRTPLPAPCHSLTRPLDGGSRPNSPSFTLKSKKISRQIAAEITIARVGINLPLLDTYVRYTYLSLLWGCEQ